MEIAMRVHLLSEQNDNESCFKKLLFQCFIKVKANKYKKYNKFNIWQ
jgi:hypothetical protein